MLPDGLGPAIETRRCNESEPVAKPRKRRTGPKPGGWSGQQRAPTDQVVVGDSEAGRNRWPGGHGEGLRRSHGEAAGAQLGAYLDNRSYE